MDYIIKLVPAQGAGDVDVADLKIEVEKLREVVEELVKRLEKLENPSTNIGNEF